MQCLTYCIAHGLDIKALETHLKNQRESITRYGEVLLQRIDKDASEILYFSNGTLVAWNMNKNKMKPYINFTKKYAQNLLPIYQFDGFLYYIDPKIGDTVAIKPHKYFNVEKLIINENDPELKLSLSYAFSQSIKLKDYEQHIERLIEDYSPLVRALAQQGKINLSRKQIYRILGRILDAKSLINLKSSYTYMPKFFWQYPNLEDYYLSLANYLDIDDRVEGLNQQLNTLNEIFNMLNSHLENRHSHFLEVIIIILIAIEILFNLLHL